MTAAPIKAIWHPRESLQLQTPNASRLARRTFPNLTGDLGFTGHWTGAGGRLYRPNPVERLRGIQAAHMAPGGLGTKNGAGDIAYAGAFDADANCYGLRDSRFVQAHALSRDNVANVTTDGLVFLEDSRGWTDGATAAFSWWCDLYRWCHEGRAPELFTHEYWARSIGSGTDCPGKPFAFVIGSRGGKT